MNCVKIKRTYSKKQAASIAVTAKASQLFDTATKQQRRSPIMVSRSNKKKNGKEHRNKNKETSNEIEFKQNTGTKEKKSDESIFMIFDTHRYINKTQKRKTNAQKNAALVEKSKRNPTKFEGKSPTSPFYLKRDANNTGTPDLILEEFHASPKYKMSNNRRKRKCTITDSKDVRPNLNKDPVCETSQARRCLKNVVQVQPNNIGKKMPDLSKIEEDKSGSSSSSYTNIEISRKSKDQDLNFMCQLPLSPIVDVVEDNKTESSDEDIMETDGNESNMEISDGEKGDNDHPPQNSSMWVTTNTDTPVPFPASVSSLSQSPPVKMRHHVVLNSTAQTAADNISQFQFPSQLSPINELTVECTPNKGNQENRFAPNLKGKKHNSSLKSKSFLVRKEDNYPKCSTKLIFSTMNDEDEEIPNVTRISSNSYFDVNDNITIPPLVKHNILPCGNSNHVSRNKKDSVECKTSSKKIANSMNNNTLEDNKRQSSTGHIKSSQVELKKNNESRTLSNIPIPINSNEEKKLKKVRLKVPESLKKDYKELDFAKEEKKTSQAESMVKSNVKKCESLTDLSFKNSLSRTSVLKKTQEIDTFQKHMLRLKKDSKATKCNRIKILSNEDQDRSICCYDSICFVNRLYNRSLKSNY